MNVERLDHFTESIAPVRSPQNPFTVRDGACLFVLFAVVALLAHLLFGY